MSNWGCDRGKTTKAVTHLFFLGPEILFAWRKNRVDIDLTYMGSVMTLHSLRNSEFNWKQGEAFLDFKRTFP